jgi:lipoprotein-releasing system permease protein
MSVTVIAIYFATMLVVAIVLNLGGWWATVHFLDRMGRKLKFVPFMAVRHLKGRKSGFLTAIGVLSILGVSFSSCTLTTVLSVMGGFSGDLKTKILRTNAHVVVDQEGQDMSDWRPVLKKIRGVEGVIDATPLVQGEMMMNARTNNHGIMMKGIDLSSFNKVSNVFAKLESGDLNYLEKPELLFEKISLKRKRLYGDRGSDAKTTLEGKDKDAPADGARADPNGIPKPVATDPRDRVLPAVIVGRELSRSLRLYEGGEVNIISPHGDIGPSGPIPKSRPFRVGGIFFSGMYEFDSVYAYVSLKAAQKFLRKGDRISEIHIAIQNPEKADAAAARIEAALGKTLRVRSWVELNAALFSALALEKIVMFIFLSLAILVASFCIIATLTMLVLEKGPEVSTLMTLGATSKEVRRIFRFEGMLIGLVGTISGLVVGLGLCLTLDNIGLNIDPEVWYLERLPVNISPLEFTLVGLASLVITQLATLYPAHAAAKLTPVEGLKYE